MDRLVCGDVGFGKTEVALRSAFVAAMNGKQVAVVVPTTLLSRQHFATFQARFKGLPLNIAQASRLVPTQGARPGQGRARVGRCRHRRRHPCAAGRESIKFRDLGLLIIDEEQHFGVKHKERLKEMRTNVHVLTLTATPIPRTLQLALSGVRELSLITTPPLDRLAVRTYISPFDPVIIRESLLREHFRGGQSFYVVPRITDLDEIADFLRENVPEVKFRVAHGRMAPTELEDIMTGFYDRQVRRAAVDHDRRIRPRHSDRQHADHPSRRHVRPGPALSAARPRRPLEAARLCALHHTRQPARSPPPPTSG